MKNNLLPIETLRDLTPFEGDWLDVPAGRGALGLMGVEGDTKYTWDRNSPAEVEAARATYEVLTKKGYAAWRLRADGSQEGCLKVFDPAAERVLYSPQMAGG